jgi:enoyl-CoA hydratase/carnithine racemase
MYLLILRIRLVSDVRKAFQDISVDNSVFSVVVSGAGRMFTAGLDCKV